MLWGSQWLLLQMTALCLGCASHLLQDLVLLEFCSRLNIWDSACGVAEEMDFIYLFYFCSGSLFSTGGGSQCTIAVHVVVAHRLLTMHGQCSLVTKHFVRSISLHQLQCKGSIMLLL